MNKSCEEVPSKTFLRGCRLRSPEESKSKKESAKPMPFSLAYERVNALHRCLTEEDVMSPVPIHTTDAFKNGTTLALNKSKMKAELVSSGFDIAEALKAPSILRTETSLSFFSDPSDTTKYMAYVKQFEKEVMFQKKEHLSLPPYVFSSRCLSLSPPGYLGPDQIDLSIILPIVAACLFNNGCLDDKPPKDSPYFKECTKLLVWSVGIIANEDRNCIRTHSIIHHYTQLSGSN
jgi:hypothetical protein